MDDKVEVVVKIPKRLYLDLVKVAKSDKMSVDMSIHCAIESFVLNRNQSKGSKRIVRRAWLLSEGHFGSEPK